jgi:hypothetical protein
MRFPLEKIFQIIYNKCFFVYCLNVHLLFHEANNQQAQDHTNSSFATTHRLKKNKTSQNAK